MKLRVFRTHRQHEQEFDITEGTTIGCAGSADIRLNDDYLSCIHARIVEEAGRYWLVDADSDNGIRNRFGMSMGGRIELVDGVRFELGEHSFQVVTPSSPSTNIVERLPPPLAISLPIAIGLLLVVVALNVFRTYLYTPLDEFQLWPAIRSVLLNEATLFMLAGVAYLVGILLRGKGYFAQVLALCVGVIVIMEIFGFVVDLINYNFGSSIILDAIDFSLKLGVQLTALYFGLKWVSHWSQRKLVSACGLFFALVIANAYVDLVEASSSDTALRNYNEKLYSERWRFVSPKTSSEWSEGAMNLFDRVESNADTEERSGSINNEPE